MHLHVSEVLRKLWQAQIEVWSLGDRLFASGPVNREIIELLEEHHNQLIAITSIPDAYQFVGDITKRWVMCVKCGAETFLPVPIEQERIKCALCGALSVVTPKGVG